MTSEASGDVLAYLPIEKYRIEERDKGSRKIRLSFNFLFTIHG